MSWSDIVRGVRLSWKGYSQETYLNDTVPSKLYTTNAI
jgi:hypothetical protein